MVAALTLVGCQVGHSIHRKQSVEVACHHRRRFKNKRDTTPVLLECIAVPILWIQVKSMGRVPFVRFLFCQQKFAASLRRNTPFPSPLPLGIVSDLETTGYPLPPPWLCSNEGWSTHFY